MVDPADSTRRKTFARDQSYEELLIPVFRGGERVYDPPPLASVRDRALASVGELDPSLTRFLNPHIYPVGLERGLKDLRTALVMRARGLSPQDAVPSPEAVAEAEAAVAPPMKEGD
jgi:nicotinate phosphoribosyltransferase